MNFKWFGPLLVEIEEPTDTQITKTMRRPPRNQ